VSWHPLAIITSVGIYLFAVVLGLVGFSLLALASQIV
jgi:hypothetical protein